MNLRKYNHKANILYEKERLDFSSDIDFFSCYENFQTDCNNCESTFKSTFFKLLAQIQIHKSWNFMDCGCGLGLPLFLASSSFYHVYGVEILQDVSLIAKQNLDRLNVSNYTIINSDINSVSDEIVNKINVFYLFNPFLNTIFSKFIQKIANSVANADREIWIIYVNATQEDKMNIYASLFNKEIVLNDFRKIIFYHHLPKL